MRDIGPHSLGFGAANLGNLHHQLSDEQAFTVLETAWAAGLRYFDTAPHYGLGLSERRLGEFLQSKPRNEYTISTKVGRLLRPNPAWSGELDTENDFMVPANLQRVWDVTPAGIRRSVEESLERLGIDKVDIIYLHDPERYGLGASLAAGIPSLVALRDEGIASRVGVGSMSLEALEASARTGEIDVLMAAGRYTLAEPQTPDFLIETCHNNNVDIVVASVFNSGLLASGSPSEGSLYDYVPVPADILRRVREIASVCREYDVELPAAALQFPLRSNAVDTVVVASATPFHIVQNVEWATTPIPDELWDDLTERRLIPE